MSLLTVEGNPEREIRFSRFRFARVMCVLFLGLIPLAIPAKAAIYYVATNGSDMTGNGSAGNPWATIGHADSQSLLIPGDTVIVAAGTYPQASGDGVVLQNNAGASGAPITYLANGKVVIDQSEFSGQTYGFQMRKPYLVVSGFEIKGAAHGIMLDGSLIWSGNNCVVTNCLIHDSAPVDSSGVYLNKCGGARVVRNVIYNISAGANSPWAPIGAGIRMRAGGTNFLWNNTIDNAYLGVFVYGSSFGATDLGHISTLNNIVVNAAGWGFVNPWSTDPSLFTSGYNLVYNDAVTYGNYPAGNNGPLASDVTSDPQFVFSAAHDYLLLSNSPALDAGTNVGMAYQGSAPDLGAFEGPNPVAPIGTIQGKVLANVAGNPPLAGVSVQTTDGSFASTSDANGSFQLVLPSGTEMLQATGPFLTTQVLSTNVAAGGLVTLNFSLSLTNTPKTNYVDNATGNDANPGTEAQPWKTIDHGDAIGALNPGDTVIIKAGIYAPATLDGVNLTNTFGYNFAPVTYQAQGSVVVDQSGVIGSSYGFRVAVPAITLEGFEVKGAEHGIYLGPGSDFATVDSCVIHDANATSDASGIYVNQSANLILTRNVIYNINAATNSAWSPAGAGIRLQGGNHVNVFNNTIDNAFLGVFCYGGAGLGSGPEGLIKTENNIVNNCTGWGFVNPWGSDSSKFLSGYNLVYNDAITFGNYPAGNNGPVGTDLAADPQFVNAAAHNYQLQNSSSALNMGLVVGLPYIGVAPDLGALESSFIPTLVTYYVDGATGNDANPGTQAQPWKTIANGATKGVLKPGDTVMVDAGNYVPANSAGVDLRGQHGAPTAPINYDANGNVVIDQSAASLPSYGLKLGPATKLQGFEIKGAEYGVYVTAGSDSATVDSCVIHDANGTGSDASGIYVGPSSNVRLTRNVIYNINAANTPWSPVGSGIEAQGPNNLQVLNNTINNCYLGVFFYGGGGKGAGPYGRIITENNIVANCTGWGFVNPWSTDSSLFTSGYNLVYNDTNSYGNFPAGNATPLLTDVTADPLFVNSGGGDFRLRFSSPAIAQGTDVGLPYIGLAPTIGAYQSPLSVSQPTSETVTNGSVATITANVQATQPYIVQWLRNGVAIPDATNTYYTVPSASFCDGDAVFSAVVITGLGAVTNEGTTLNVTAPAPRLQISASQEGTNVVANLSIDTLTKESFEVHASTNLTKWDRFSKFPLTSGGVLSLSTTLNARKSFYRAALVPPDPSFSFTYNGISSTQLLSGWNSNRTDSVLDSNRVQSVEVFTDPSTGLQVTCKAIEYSDVPAVEWVLYFKNTGGMDTPILEKVNAIDMQINRGDCGEFVLHYNDGCSATPTDFQPHQTNLAPGVQLSFAPTGGRSSSDTAFPYYNIWRPEGSGEAMAIGWSGQWTSSFARDSTTNLTIKAGMELTHLVLKPGEEIRSPSILMISYQGTWIDGQNAFRKLMERYYTPKPNGQPLVVPVAASPHGYIGLSDTSESNMLMTISNIASNSFPVDTYWIDAGWFYSSSIWELGTGNWFPDPSRYPRGMKPVADAAHANGMKFLLWFEPERVMPNTRLYNSHPEWLLSGDVTMAGEPCYLLNLGNPDAVNWAVTNFSSMIGNIGIDVYRLDFNMPPLNYWRGNDATNRQGITEIKYIMGLYSFLDGLVTNHPSLIIDNSSAAGHRLDFEMARRSIPINRSDYGAPIGEQGMEYGLSLWLPYQGVGSYLPDPYVFRSGMGETAVYFFPGFGNVDDPSWNTGKQMVNYYKSLRHFYLDDFYPLTPYQTNTDSWLAYEFNEPESAAGIVHAFCRDNASHVKAICFAALEANATYKVTNPDNTNVIYATGAQLMSSGVIVDIPSRPGAAIFEYRKVP